MKTANLNPPGGKALDIARGRVGKRAGTPGSKIADAQGNEVVAPDQLFIGATVSGEDGEQAIITINGTGQQVTNDSGGDLEYGDVVVQNADGSVTTTTTPQDTRPIGVVQIGGGDGAPVSVQFSGYVAQVNTTAAVTEGNYAETSSTPGEATENATPRAGSFGRFLGTGSNPPAVLFGQTYLTGGGSGGGGGGVPSWFNVVDYGAVGDGSTDDTASINLAIAALISAGKGVLYFPAGTFKVASALTTLSVPCTVLGDGKGGFFGTTTAVSRITCTSTTAVVFTVSAAHVMFRGLAFDQSSGTPTAGSAVASSTSNGLERIDFDACSIEGFYIGLDLQGTAWTVHNCHFYGTQLYDIRVRNTAAPDFGDWTISDCSFWAAVAGGSAIRVESSGGGKITNCKINMAGVTKYTSGINVAIPNGIVTSILLISNVSIENISGDGIDIVTSGTGTYGAIILRGIQFGMFSNTTGVAVAIAANTLGEIKDVILDDLVCVSTGGNANPAITLSKVQTTHVGRIVVDGFAGGAFTQTGSSGVVDDTGSVGGGIAITGFAAPTFTLGTAGAAGAAGTIVRSDATIAAFDATAPSTQAIGDAAATGSAAVAARRDHKHAMPSFGSPVPVGTTNSDGSAVTIARSDHVHQGSSTGLVAFVAQEEHTSDGATTTFTLEQVYEPNSVFARNQTTGAWLSVTEVLPDQATVSAAGSAGDKITFGYAPMSI